MHKDLNIGHEQIESGIPHQFLYAWDHYSSKYPHITKLTHAYSCSTLLTYDYMHYVVYNNNTYWW